MGPRQVGKTTMIIQLLAILKTDYVFETADRKGLAVDVINENIPRTPILI
ncbi:MAG: hypothetical protein ACYCZO_01870 [Daejeonella sp.]